MARLDDLVRERSIIERHRPKRIGPDEWEVPWQTYTGNESNLTVHSYTGGSRDGVGARVEETGNDVRVTLLARSTREEGCVALAWTVTLSRPLGTRRVIDPTSGRVREQFAPDPALGWRLFDEATAYWLLGIRDRADRGGGLRGARR
jgi:hypothetical protein